MVAAAADMAVVVAATAAPTRAAATAIRATAIAVVVVVAMATAEAMGVALAATTEAIRRAMAKVERPKESLKGTEGTARVERESLERTAKDMAPRAERVAAPDTMVRLSASLCLKRMRPRSASAPGISTSMLPTSASRSWKRTKHQQVRRRQQICIPSQATTKRSPSSTKLAARPRSAQEPRRDRRSTARRPASSIERLLATRAGLLGRPAARADGVTAEVERVYSTRRFGWHRPLRPG
mmetsp:Transcript_106954/g.255247  ORF Transcript_106954/g.255247 Transcript_106954/m.255247 type:complete len:239 (+) Transcript_106954:690-1406(+)